jgi:hypothetical protein
MADRTWHKAFLLAAVGVALAAGCTINSDGDNDDDEGEAGSSGTGGKGGSGGTAGKGGSSGSSGSGGSSAGTAGKGGSAGTTGGSAGTGGGTSGTAGEGGEAGMGDTRMDPLCDPDSGELPSTPYGDCSPATGEENDACALCIEESCCEESDNCYAYAPGNVCGWGGPQEDGVYLGGGEIGCFRSCILEFVEMNGAYDQDAEDECAGSCATEVDSAGMSCGGLLGNATNIMIGCLHDNCETECFELE